MKRSVLIIQRSLNKHRSSPALNVRNGKGQKPLKAFTLESSKYFFIVFMFTVFEDTLLLENIFIKHSEACTSGFFAVNHD